METLSSSNRELLYLTRDILKGIRFKHIIDIIDKYSAMGEEVGYTNDAFNTIVLLAERLLELERKIHGTKEKNQKQFWVNRYNESRAELEDMLGGSLYSTLE